MRLYTINNILHVLNVHHKKKNYHSFIVTRGFDPKREINIRTIISIGKNMGQYMLLYFL